MSQRDLKRLAQAVQDRRAELSLSQGEFARRGNMGLKTVQRIEAAKIDPRVQTLGKLDAAADWRPGSARRVLEGGRPASLGATPVRIPPPEELVRMPITDVLKVRDRVREIKGDEEAAEFWQEFLAYSDRRSRDQEHQP